MNPAAPFLMSLWSLREDCGFRSVPGDPGAGVVSTPGETSASSRAPPRSAGRSSA